MTADPVTAPLHCARCGNPVTVELMNWQQGGTQHIVQYACPWCHLTNSFRAPGELLSVWQGHGPEPDRPGH